jgi:hypothetical protein
MEDVIRVFSELSLSNSIKKVLQIAKLHLTAEGLIPYRVAVP